MVEQRDLRTHMAIPLSPAPNSPIRVNTNAELLEMNSYVSQFVIYIYK